MSTPKANTTSRYTNEELLQIEEDALKRKDELPHIKLKAFPREWYLDIRSNKIAWILPNMDVVYDKPIDKVHVIEISALKDLQAKYDRLMQEADNLVEALNNFEDITNNGSPNTAMIALRDWQAFLEGKK